MDKSREKKLKEYYCIDDLLSRHFIFNFICGDRGAGKTWRVQSIAIKKAIRSKGKEQFAIFVRYKDDIKDRCENYFDDIMEQKYPEYEMIFKTNKFYLKKKNNEKDKGILVGYAFAIKRASKKKSSAIPSITTFINEEFCNIENEYIANSTNRELEVELFISFIATLARGKGKQFRDDIRVFCVSNCYYLDNPYFRYYGLIDQIVKDPFKRFYVSDKKPKCIVEMTHNDLSYEFARDDVSKGNKWLEMQHELKFIKNPQVKNVSIQLTFDNKEFLNVAPYNDTMIVFSNGNKRREGCFCWSCSSIRKKGIMDIRVLKKGQHKEIWERIVKIARTNRMYYDKLESFMTLISIIDFSPNSK